MLLNSKSILECDEFEEQEHNQEILDIVDEISELPNYDCAVVIKSLDPAHKNVEDKIMACSLYDFLETIEYVDIKNGVDIEIGDNNVLNLICYGSTYTLNEKHYLVKNSISILPYDENREFLDLSYLFIGNDIQLNIN